MITLAFVHVGIDNLLPRIMVAYARRAMPDARIVHLTDQETAPIIGVDEVIRNDYDGIHLMTFRLAQFACLRPCEVVFLDTDVIMEKDLGPLFSAGFDAALTRRNNVIRDPTGINAAEVMPYNTGVMLSKPSGWDLWYNAWKYCETLPDATQRWWGDQYAIKAVAKAAPLRILELPCDLYNYSPDREEEDLSERFIVHYKGQRKRWMVRRAREELGLM